MSIRLRATLALVLIVLFPIFVVALVAVLAGIAVLIGIKVPVIGAKIGLIALPLVWALWKGASAAVRATHGGPMPGVELSRAEHPAFWAELDGLTAAMGQRPVERAVVQPVVNAAVTEATGRRELAVGLPFLAAFDRAELRAVLAHELGHFQRGHTAGGLRAYRAQLLFRRTLAELRGSIVFRLVAGYYQGYLRVTMPLLREREFEADEWSARLAGPEAAASVLSRVDALDVAWTVLGRDVMPEVRPGQPGPSPSVGLRNLLAGPLRPKFDEVAQEALARPADRYDTHPGAGERVARIRSRGFAVPPTAERLDQPASSLLGAGEASLEQLERALELTGTSVQDWDAAVAASVLGSAGEQADVLLGRLAEVRPGVTPTAAGVLAAIAAGQGPVLVAPLVRADIPAAERAEVHREVLFSVLRGLLVDTLARQDRLRVAAGWGPDGPRMTMLDPDGAELPFPDGTVRAALLDPAGVTELIGRLGATGADLDRPPSRPVRTGPVGSVPVGALTDMFARQRGLKVGSQPTFDLVAYDDGLLVSPAPPQPLGSGPSLTGSARHDPERLGRIVRAAGKHPAEWAAPNGARWIPYARVASSVWEPSTPRWRLRLHDGEELVWTPSRATSSDGEPWAVVGRAIT